MVIDDMSNAKSDYMLRPRHDFLSGKFHEGSCPVLRPTAMITGMLAAAYNYVIPAWPWWLSVPVLSAIAVLIFFVMRRARR